MSWREVGRKTVSIARKRRGRPVMPGARGRRERKLVEGSDLYRFVHGKLVHLHWSPAQIAQRLRLMKPDDPSPM